MVCPPKKRRSQLLPQSLRTFRWMSTYRDELFYHAECFDLALVFACLTNFLLKIVIMKRPIELGIGLGETVIRPRAKGAKL